MDQICRANIQTTENLRIFFFGGGVHLGLALSIGVVIAKRNILYCFAYLSRRRLLIWLKYVFKQKLHVQMANSHRSPQPRLKPNHSYLSDPPHFSLLSTFKFSPGVIRYRTRTISSSSSGISSPSTPDSAPLAIWSNFLGPWGPARHYQA